MNNNTIQLKKHQAIRMAAMKPINRRVRDQFKLFILAPSGLRLAAF